MSNNGDDFEDELDPSETEEFDDEQAGDEDWDEYEDQPGDENLDEEDSDEAAPKKKSGAFNKILIAVGVLVVGGMVAMQFGKGGNAPAPAPVPAPVTAEAPATPAEQAPAGMLGSADELAKMAAMAKHNAPQAAAPETSPAPAPVATPSEPAPVAVATPPVTETIPVATPKEVPNIPTPPMPSPVGAPEKVAEAAPAATPVLDATPAPAKSEEGATRIPSAHDMMLKSTTPPDVTPAPAPTPSGNADTAALNMKMDTILSRLTSLEGEVSTLKKKPDADEQVADLKSSIDALEKKVSSIGSAPASSKSSKKAAAPSETQDAPPAPSHPVIPEEKPAPQILGGNDAEPEIHPVAGIDSEQPVKKAAPRAVKVSTSWVLKGAQPGQATVAKPGESDSRTVRVGDTLPGIGKITAVEYQDGRWAVIGTQGRINQ